MTLFNKIVRTKFCINVVSVTWRGGAWRSGVLVPGEEVLRGSGVSVPEEVVLGGSGVLVPEEVVLGGAVYRYLEKRCWKGAV